MGPSRMCTVTCMFTHASMATGKKKKLNGLLEDNLKMVKNTTFVFYEHNEKGVET